MTGHVVVDTATYWTPFGQVVIMALIQVGGLGIMTFATLIGLVVVRRISLRSRLTTAAEARGLGLHDFPNILGQVVKTTLLVEATVAALLFFRFILGYGEPVDRAAWLAVFHSVSSFNNAGFSLFSDNLVSYVADPFICIPIAAAIILGGIGFPVILQLRKHLRSPLKWTMNTRLVLLGTITLLAAGTVYVTAIEWSNPATLGPLDWPAKLLAGFFTSVQTRTAGFNSIDIGAMDPASWIGMDVLMLIGGGPAGTAGGIKITTFAVLFFILMTEVRHSSRPKRSCYVLPGPTDRFPAAPRGVLDNRGSLGRVRLFYEPLDAPAGRPNFRINWTNRNARPCRVRRARLKYMVDCHRFGGTRKSYREAIDRNSCSTLAIRVSGLDEKHPDVR